MIGLLGVVVGGILAGGVQAVAGYWERRMASRTRARYLAITLLEATLVVAQAIRDGGWRQLGDFAPTRGAWQATDPVTLARGLDANDFRLMCLAFATLQHLDGVRAANRAMGTADDGFSVVKERLPGDLMRCQQAATAAWRAGETIKERADGEAPKRDLERELGLPPGIIP